MGDLKCEYPEGCKLDLWINVVKAKYMDELLILDDTFCILESEVGGEITGIEDIRIRVLNTSYSFNFSSISICIEYKIIIVVLVNDEEQIVTITNTYNQIIKLDEFDPPLTTDEFKSEVDQAEIILMNWHPDGDIVGDCFEPDDPSFFSPVPGTLLRIKLMVCMVVKLGKMHDIIVYGELDPEC